MDIGAHVYSPLSNHSLKSSIQQCSSLPLVSNFASSLSSLPQVDNSNHQLSDKKFQSDWSCNPFLINEIEESFPQKIYSGWRKQRFAVVTETQGQLSEDCQNQNLLSCQWENVMQYEIKDTGGQYGASSFIASSQPPLSITTPVLCVSPSCYNLPPPYTGFDYSVASSAGCNKNNTNGVKGSHGFQGETNLIKDASLTENNLSVFHGDASSLFVNNLETDKYITMLPNQFSESIPGDFGTLSSMTAWKSKSGYDGSLQPELQMLGLSNCLQQPAYSDKLLKVQTRGCPTEIDCSKQPYMVQQEVQLQQACSHQATLESPAIPSNTTVAANPTKSIPSLDDILLSYMNYKSLPLNAGRTRENFLDDLHLTVCNVQNCECESYCRLISHFDECHYTGCSICGPVQQLYPTGETHSGAGKLKKHLSGDIHARDSYHINYCIVEDIQPPLKRRKMESGNLSQNRPPSAVMPPVSQPCRTDGSSLLGKWSGSPAYLEDEGLKIKNELIRSTEDSIGTGVNVKFAVDNNRLKFVNANHQSLAAVTHPVNQPCEGLEELIRDGVSFSVDKNRLESANTCFRRTAVYSESKQSSEGPMYDHYDASDMKKELLMFIESPPVMDDASTTKVKTDATLTPQGLSSDITSLLSEECASVQEENSELKDLVKYSKKDIRCELAEPASYCQLPMESEDPKRYGVSLTDFFNIQQIKVHLSSLNESICQSIKRGSTENTSSQSLGQNTCQLCAADRLMFTPPPIYCSYCRACIKCNMTYYWTQDEMGARHCFCTFCFRRSSGGNISLRGQSFSKAKLQKDTNEAETEEPWVQCDACKCWQHQICALYNARTDSEGKGKYICPICRLAEPGIQEHVSMPITFGAKDLPRTKLSLHIEQSLFKSLDRERKERAKLCGKSPTEVPGAADLVVRVVYTANKQLKVKKQFLDIFHGQHYPAEFLYKSKVILLFQNIEGVDVCLFAMYVQEFGSECGPPNQRSVYVSYLDSVKYFRPDIRTTTGEALRSFVYHEILIGYLDYCKKCGYATCYLWACPPIKGEDYILYCHPSTQKTPKSDKLRHWYKSMIKKAMEKNVVVDYTNFYDHYFVADVKSNMKITAARLPYFDGDYWSGAAEDVILDIYKESGGESEGISERMIKKAMTRRTLKAMGHSDLSDRAMKDLMVMEKLGQTILPRKEDFIILHLQYTCTNCHEVILSGSRWSCKQCKKIYLCPRCLEEKPCPDELKTHTSISGEKHVLSQILVTDIPFNTEDNDVILDKNIFDDRCSFLSFCEENNYQFDTLRRAKHSCMMILYHLHKYMALTKGRTCSICHKDIMLGWCCEICPHFDVCCTCYKKEGNGRHVHGLTQDVIDADSGKKIKQTEKRKSVVKKEVLDLLVHANQCQATGGNPCSYPNCIRIKRLFRHTRECELRLAGHCKQCKRIWCLLLLHSQNCRHSNCHIPRCMDIKMQKTRTQLSGSPQSGLTSAGSCTMMDR